MNYILIFVFAHYGLSAPTASLSVEFNSMAACQAAAAELKRQNLANKSSELPILMCAAKGKQP